MATPKTYISKEYSAAPNAVFIPPIEFVHNGLTFVNTGSEILFGGVTNETTSHLVSMLYPRRVGPYRKLVTWPPKSKTQKWWKAMLVFRGLDITSRPPELQARLKEYLEAEVRKEVEDRASGATTTVLAEPSLDGDAARDWRAQNEAVRARLWDALPLEEKLKKNSLKVFREASYKEATFFRGPSLSDVQRDTMRRDLDCFVYTRTNEEGAQYSRGKFVGVGGHGDPGMDEYLEHDDHLGATWVGTGFENGVIVGESLKAIKTKIEEMCEKVEVSYLRQYTEKGRSSGSNALVPVTSSASNAIKTTKSWLDP